ncbi:MAG: hypothetical protein NTY74_16300 [Ignavibacteriae bacterium]|nr:hypothetical protein [Ignavibacteriota bacterium]
MEESWLTRKLTIEEAETEHLVKDDRLGSEPVPFGFNNASWKQLLSMMQNGDELWEYCSPKKTWELLMGVAGIAILRNGEIVGAITTLEN